MIRQFAIASAGRTASTSLYQTLVDTLGVRHAVRAVWDFSPAGLLREAYAGDRYDYVVVKGETFQFLGHLQHPEKTTLVLLTRRDQLRQVTSHLVALRAGRFHAGATPLGAAGAAGRIAPFRVERHEFLFLAHLVLAMEHHFDTADHSRFARVERWAFEELVADFPGHLARLGVAAGRTTKLLGVGYDAASLSNADEVFRWAEQLAPEGFRIGSAGAAAAEPAAP